MEMQTAKTLITLAIGDRVIFRGSKATEGGTVTQVLHDGVLRVLWDGDGHSPLQFSELLVKRMHEVRRG